LPRRKACSSRARYVEARTQASRAQAQFKEGSPGWLKADDILNYRPPKTDRYIRPNAPIHLRPIHPTLL
jgi:predicted Zn-dependent protease